MIRRNNALVAGVVAMVLLGASACSKGDDSSKTDPTTGKALEKVTYLTAFGAAGRDAFAYVAKEKGFFKDEGLDVTIQLGKATGSNVSQVVAGTAQYANLDLTGAWITQGTDPKVKDKFKTIAAIHQQSLVAIFTLKSSKLTTPADLKGKKIGAATASVNQLLWPAYAKLAGVDPNSVTWVNTQPASVPQLLASKQVDAVSTFLIGEGNIKTVAKEDVNVMRYNNYLSDLFGNGIIANADVLKSNPDQAKRMNAALMKGLQYSIANPEEAATIMAKAEPSAKIPAAKGEITSMTPYVSAAGGAPLGSMDKQRVAKSLAILQGAGLTKVNLTPEDVVDFAVAPSAS